MKGGGGFVPKNAQAGGAGVFVGKGFTASGKGYCGFMRLLGGLYFRVVQMFDASTACAMASSLRHGGGAHHSGQNQIAPARVRIVLFSAESRQARPAWRAYDAFGLLIEPFPLWNRVMGIGFFSGPAGNIVEALATRISPITSLNRATMGGAWVSNSRERFR